MLRFAVIGAGRIGAVHAASIAQHPDCELVLVADPDLASAQRLAAASGGRATGVVDDVFTDHRVDAVIVGSPTRFHVDQIVAAVAAGKAVLVEKPVDLDLARVDACLAAIGDQAHRIMVGFNRRFDPGFAEIHAHVRDGVIGPVEQLTIISRDPAAPPASYVAGSGGIFRDMTIHDLDMARFMLGDITQVHAVGQHLDADIEAAGDWDAAVLTLTAASGAVATIINSRHCATGYDQRLEAFGPLGSLEALNHTATAVVHHSATTSGARGRYLDFFLERYTKAYAAELEHFVTSIRDGVAPSPSLADGREALALADAATLSANTGQPVKVA
ncbi:myo-inositol 2-dehydrogenase [Sanguibacter gelidistatuariae]|uniref:Myo-inositol 2-dehydrogenase n=1 Tax=Sanguibacter gelidistatuariae TaxID=1814289 RepID=A0A1G6HPQ1_9MICO|nr:inositol 2-dehydrogenase [Sanguibacter gelidistatuariae]SDB96118.1 myo-inositol 2-dehydrogenase [Sanguibacter gelidistatuariae]